MKLTYWPGRAEPRTTCGTIEEFELRLAGRTGILDPHALRLADSGTQTCEADEPLTSPFPRHDDVIERRRPRILIADDEPRIRLAVRVCLEAEGYEVEEAADGREALTALTHFAPDLLLLDLAMPNLDGLSTLRLLSTVYADVAPPVLVLTAHGSILIAEASERYGARAFLEKPMIPEMLRATVRRILEEEDGRPMRRRA